jgi:hypothetical protein
MARMAWLMARMAWLMARMAWLMARMAWLMLMMVVSVYYHQVFFLSLYKFAIHRMPLMHQTKLQ